MWKKIVTFSVDGTQNVSFRGRGSIFADGTFGGGVLQLHVIARDEQGSAPSVSTGFMDDAIDGSIIKSIDCPSGEYQIQLTGSTSPTVNVYVNDQVDINISH